MRTSILAALACLIAAQAMSADPITLKCRLPDGSYGNDVTVDLEGETLYFGHSRLTITASNDQYVTAINTKGEVGGDVFVINRETGEYKLAAVGILYSPEDLDADFKPKKPGELGAYTGSGRCAPKLF